MKAAGKRKGSKCAWMLLVAVAAVLSAAAAEQGPVILNIFPKSLGNEEKTAADIRNYVRATGERKVLYSMSFHPEGFPAKVKADRLIASFARLTELLKDDDVELCALIQSVLGHGWVREGDKAEKWTRSARIGTGAPRFCVLDPGFRAYVRDFVTGLAKQHPAFILGDDDIHQRDECFCELHRREFNRRAGTDYSPEEFRTKVSAAKPGERDHDVFYALQRESLIGFCALMREAIDAVDPKIRAGICMSGREYATVGDLAKALAAKGQKPFLRIANDGDYSEYTNDGFDFETVRTAVHAALYARDFDTVEESDTCPHNHWARSGATVRAKMSVALMYGIGGGLHWYAGARKGGYEVPVEFLEAITEPRGFYRELKAFAGESEAVGLVIPAMTRFVENRMTGSESTVPGCSWGERLAIPFGFPIRSAAWLDEKGVYALAGGKAVGRLSDDDLRTLLSGRLLLDGDAVREVARRGFTNELGVTVEDRPDLFTSEVSADGAHTYSFVRNEEHPSPYMTAAAGAETLTVLKVASFPGASDARVVGPGVVLFRNALGGTVVSTAWTMETGGRYTANTFSRLSDGRKDWFVRVLERLDGADLYVENRQDVVALARRKADGTRLLFVLNLNRDPMRTVDVHVRGTVSSLEELGLDGAYRPAAFTRNGDSVSIAKTLPSYGFAAWRIGN